MAESPKSVRHVRPLLVGRLSRIVFGFVIIYFSTTVWHKNVAAIATSLAVLLFGLSFVIGGLIANPGCEITALLNLVRAENRRVHCY